MTTSIPGPALPPSVELDLDTAAERPPERASHRTLIALVALVLVGGTAGLVTGALRSQSAPPPGIEAEVTFVESHYDQGPVATLRFTVHNPQPAPITITGVRAGGITTRPVHIGITHVVKTGTTETVDVTVEPDCNRFLDAQPMTATLTLAGGGTAPVLPPPALQSAGGLCRQVRADLPAGWADPLLGGRVQRVGPDLRVQLPAVAAGSRLAGVWAGELLLATRTPVQIVNGVLPPLQLVLPNACPLPANVARVPTGVRLLLIDADGLRQRYAPLGPELAAWLLQSCP